VATLTYSGTQSSSVSLNSRRTINLSGSSVQNAVATGYITVRLYCSTNAYSKTYEIHASVSGYEGSTSFKFDSSNYGGATISFQIWVGTSFNVNGVSSITVWDATANASKVFIKNNQYVDVDYVTPSAPGAPTNVTLGGVAGNTYTYIGNSVNLAWSGASAGTANPIYGYEIYQGSSLYTTVYTSSTSGSVNVPSSSSVNGSYTYSVKTLGNYSNSGNSTSRTVYSYDDCSAPGAVTVNNATPDAGTNVTLSWNGAQGGGNYNAITGYDVYRATSASGTYSYLTSVSTTGTSGSCTVTAHATQGSSYYYKVVTKCAYTDSGYSSAYATVTSKVYTACSAPTTVTLNGAAANLYAVAGTTITLAWSGAAPGTNNAISGYQIWQGNTLLETVSASTSSRAVPMHAAAGSGYSYAIVTLGAAGLNSGASVARSVYTTTLPSAPTTVTLDGETAVYKKPGNTALLAWSGAAVGTLNAISGYKVYQGNTLYATVAASVSSYIVPAHADVGGSYAYSVVTVGAHNDSAKSTARTFYSFGDPTAPSVLTLATNAPDAGESVRLSWANAVAGSYNAIVGYDVYRSDTADGVYSKIGSTVLTSSTSGNTNVTAPTTMGNSYYYKVLVVGARSNSALTTAYAGMTATVYSDCTPPSTVRINGAVAAYVASGGAASLSWSGAQGGTNNAVTGYKIYRSTTLLATVAASVSSYSVTGSTSIGGSYVYTIVSVGAHSDSVASAAVTLYTYGLPSAPTTLEVSNSSPDAGTAVTLSWSGAAAGSYNGITGYNVYRSTSADGSYSLIGSVTTTNTYGSMNVAAHATMGSTYYFKVKALGEYGDSNLSDAYVGVTSKVYTACSAPTNVTLSRAIANPGAESVLSWSGAQGGTNTSVASYEVWRATSATGSYSLLAAVSGASLAVIAHATQGSSYFYKVKAVSSPAGYTSALSEVYAELVTNTYPDAPIIDAPAANKTTYNSRPRLLVTVGEDVNNVSQTISASGYDVSSPGALVIGKRVVIRKRTALEEAGAQTASVISTDSLGGASSAASVSFAFAVKAYTDAELVAGLTAVKAAHITELRAVLDDICDYYGIARTVWAHAVVANVTSLLGWVSHVTEIQNTITRVAAYINDWDADTSSLNVTLPAFLTATAPTASVITQLREIVKLL
jgi:hypothetical protein